MVVRATLVAAAVLVAGAGVMASEKKIQKKDLPAAVQKAMESEVQGATVKGFSKETEEGKTFYEVETTKDGHTRDILFDASGTVVEVEEELAMDAVPAAAKTALSAQGKLTKVESVTKGGTTVYEGHFAKGAKKSEVKVTAEGKPVSEK